MLKTNELLDIAIQASIEAGKAIMKVYNTDFEVEEKSDKSPITLADKNANEVINSFLLTTGIPIISEENKEIDYSVRSTWDRCWIVDPVDGTKEFVKRNGEFTVNIALVQDGRPILGVIYVPAQRLLYYGNVIAKTTTKALVKENGELDHQDLRQIEPSSESYGIKVVGSRSHMNEETKQFVENLKRTYSDVQIISRGSSLKFCLIVEGGADIYPRFAPTMEWDTAAGQAICNSAGINVICVDSQEPMTYNKPNLLNPWFRVSK